MLNLTSLALFLQAVKHQSLSRAAEESHISLSAASRRISLLEHYFHVSLMDRTSSGVAPTVAGEALVRHALELMRGVDVMRAEMSDYANGAVGRVRLFANTSAMGQSLPDQLASFSEKFPDISLEVKELRSGEIIDAVRQGRADVGVVTTVIKSSELRFEPYCMDRLCAIVPKNLPIKATRLDFASLLDYDIVGLDPSAAISALLAEVAALAGKPLRLRFQVQSFEAVCRLIAAGRGIGVLPEGAVKTFRSSMALRFITLTDAWAERQMWLCLPERHLSAPSRKLVEHLRSTAGNGTGIDAGVGASVDTGIDPA